jgi:hypothetical protein
LAIATVLIVFNVPDPGAPGKPFRRNPPNHGLKPRGLQRVQAVMTPGRVVIND